MPRGLVGQGSQGLPRAPQKPHKSATRRLIPTGIPRTKRHTPVYLLCVLKVWRTAGNQRRCARAGLLELFQTSALWGDRTPEKRTVGNSAASWAPLLHAVREWPHLLLAGKSETLASSERWQFRITEESRETAPRASCCRHRLAKPRVATAWLPGRLSSAAGAWVTCGSPAQPAMTRSGS
jgi:hypothetical protein